VKNQVPGDSELTAAVSRLAEALLARGLSMAAAESCTGGWIAKCCTDRAGRSAWFERGFVTYSNAANTDLLDVDPGLLEREGAVSEAVARAMAEGAVRRSAADVALAVTGIAGPDGGTPGKPVGTVWFAWADREAVSAECVRFSGDRDAVRRQSVRHALEGLLDRL